MKNDLGRNVPARIARGFCRMGIISVALPFVVALCATPGRAQDMAAKCPPPTRTDHVKETIHGVEITDSYRWLEDQTSPETRAWIDAQDRCTESVLRKLPGRDAIAARLTTLMKVDTASVPRAFGGRYFFTKRGADQDLAAIYMRKGAEGADELLVDPEPMSADHTVSVNLARVSEDGKLIAYGVRKGGEDEVTIHLMDTDTKKELPDQLPRSDYFGVVILPGRGGVYYSRLMAEGARVYFHPLGTAAANDKEIFGQGYGRDKIIGIDISDVGQYLSILVAYGSGTERSEVYVMDVKNHGPITPIEKEVQGFFNGEIAGETMYLLTNWKAPNWRVLAVDLKHPEQEKWRVVVPEGEARIENAGLAGGKLIVEYTRNATSELKLFDVSGKAASEVRLPALGTVTGLQGHWNSGEVFFGFRSFPIPETIFRYDVAKGMLTTWARPKVPIESANYEVKQVWYESKDKTKVPMFLFYKKGLKLDGARPVLMTGYGGFDVSETPNFVANAVVWAEQGGVWAVPNMRGGGEFGEAWHHAGMMANKQNVFDDFIWAAEWLIKNNYSKPAKLSIMGGSNGGLLVGAALTQRPDLFQAVVCLYPLLDMIRYQKFLVAKWWVPEYGSSDDPEQFKYIYAYSPYHHVQKGTKYPAVLFITGDGDTRVAPLHARKMAAEMQAETGSDRPVMLLYDTKSGHSGGRPIGKQIEEGTDLLSFLFWQLE
ncbi:MAG: prolyl oligopeptidase family serine peptidase [Candidatus Acidiferrales bacterium]